jgi:hypothetical protein
MDWPMDWQQPPPYRGRRRAVVIVLLVLIAALTALPAGFAFAYGVRGQALTATVVAAEPGLCRDNRASRPCWKGLVELGGRRTTVQGGPWIPFQGDPNDDLIGRRVVVADLPGHHPVSRAELGYATAFAAAGLVAFLAVAVSGRNWLSGRSGDARHEPAPPQAGPV